MLNYEYCLNIDLKNPQVANSNHKDSLDTIRSVIKNLIPDYLEEVKYGIPTVIYKGKNLIHFAEYKEHIGIYPGPEAITAFENELKDFTLSKGTIRIPKDMDLPLELIKKLVKYRIKKIDQK